MAQNSSVPLPELTLEPRSMLRDQVYDAIKGMLMDQTLEPNARLSIDGMARKLGVSPTPVREALTKLESDGLVAKRPHAGYTVAPLMDESTLDNLFDIRLLLEPAAANRAARNVSAEQVAELRALLDQMAIRPAGENYKGYRDFAVLDAQLHRLIADASGNPLISDALTRLHTHTHSYRLYFKVGIAEDAMLEHQLIVHTIAAHDGKGAEQAMRRHITASHTRLKKAYREGD